MKFAVGLLLLALAVYADAACSRVFRCIPDSACSCPSGTSCASSFQTVCEKRTVTKNVVQQVPTCQPILTRCGAEACKYNEKCTANTVCERGWNGRRLTTYTGKKSGNVLICKKVFTCEAVKDPRLCTKVPQRVCSTVNRTLCKSGHKCTVVPVEECKTILVEKCEPFKPVPCGKVTCEIGSKCVNVNTVQKVPVEENVCKKVPVTACVKGGVPCGKGQCPAGFKCATQTVCPTSPPSRPYPVKGPNRPSRPHPGKGPSRPTRPPRPTPSPNPSPGPSPSVTPSAATTSLSFVSPTQTVAATTANTAGTGSGTSASLADNTGSDAVAASAATQEGSNVATASQSTNPLQAVLAAASASNNSP